MGGLNDKKKRLHIEKFIYKQLNDIREIEDSVKLISTSGGLTA